MDSDSQNSNSSSSPPSMNHLPSELISQIFSLTLPGENQPPSFKSSESPLLLTHICHQWRTIATSTPRLWGRLTIPDWQELPKDALELVKLWVSQSGEAPLNVNVALFNEDVLVFPDYDVLEELYELLREVVMLLKPHRGRIKRFRGVFPEFLMKDVGVSEMTNAEHIYYCGMLGDKSAMGFEFLEAEEGEDADSARIEGFHTKLDIGPQRNALHSLAICGCAANIPSIKLQSQLTRLELLDLHRGGELCQETAFSLLQNMPLLQMCVLDLTKFERQEWAPPERRLVMEHLDLLFVSWVFPADIDSFLDCIACPKLDKLGLRGTPMVARRPWSGLHDFLEASHSPISRISLGDFSAIDAQYLRCFAQLPNLVHLTINHAELSDALFRALTPGDPSWDPTLLPNLQIFNMGVCEGFELDSIINFLKGRAQNPPEGVQKLTESAIMYCLSIEERHVPALKECGVQNLVVEAAENDSVYPYARVVETHRELLAVLYQTDEGDDDLPPLPDFDEEEGSGDGDGDGDEPMQEDGHDQEMEGVSDESEPRRNDE